MSFDKDLIPIQNSCAFFDPEAKYHRDGHYSQTRRLLIAGKQINYRISGIRFSKYANDFQAILDLFAIKLLTIGTYDVDSNTTIVLDKQYFPL